MYDEWDEFIGILANAISKYIDEMELDTLPDPEPINETSSVVLNKNMSNEWKCYIVKTESYCYNLRENIVQTYPRQ